MGAGHALGANPQAAPASAQPNPSLRLGAPCSSHSAIHTASSFFAADRGHRRLPRAPCHHPDQCERRDPRVGHRDHDITSAPDLCRLVDAGERHVRHGLPEERAEWPPALLHVEDEHALGRDRGHYLRVVLLVLLRQPAIGLVDPAPNQRPRRQPEMHPHHAPHCLPVPKKRHPLDKRRVRERKRPLLHPDELQQHPIRPFPLLGRVAHRQHHPRLRKHRRLLAVQVRHGLVARRVEARRAHARERVLAARAAHGHRGEVGGVLGGREVVRGVAENV
mmetsp:Transcript_11011/g.27731  ORF Transcript_11011/g.27731 Transcript_11011/m.27731 type:complete len:277 (+) Transcript_11011:648-1478(+)